MDPREERIGKNEILFREINERLKEVQDDFDVLTERADFVCECGYANCTSQITMSFAEYEALRSDPLLFAIVTGHEIDDVEAIVEKRRGYDIVRKRAGDPAKLAVEENPRG